MERTRGRLLLVHLSVYAIGALLLWWIASPIRGGDIAGLESVSWPMLSVPALVLGLVGGSVEGLARRISRHGFGWIAWVVFGVASVVGFYPAAFFVGRLPSESERFPTGIDDFIAAELAWLVFLVILTGIAVAVAGSAGQSPTVDTQGSTAGRDVADRR